MPSMKDKVFPLAYLCVHAAAILERIFNLLLAYDDDDDDDDTIMMMVVLVMMLMVTMVVMAVMTMGPHRGKDWGGGVIPLPPPPT